jgi:hypothetical protein
VSWATTFISVLVEKRVLVEVGGADRQPAIVDDRNLRVHVDGIDERT